MEGLSQGEIIGAVNNFSDENDVMISAAGSLPGDFYSTNQCRNRTQRAKLRQVSLFAPS